MSSDRELTRIVRSWLDEGVNALPDRVLDDVLAQLPVTSQRRPWWRAWRKNVMNSTLRFAVAGAAVFAVAAVALAVYFSRPALSPAGTPSASQSPSVTVATPTQPAVNPPPGTPLMTTQPTSPVGNAPFVVFMLTDGNRRPQYDLWAMRADGTGAQKLIAQFSIPNIAWSQDGGRLLAVINDGDGASQVHIAEVSAVIGPFIDTGFTTGADTACLEKTAEPSFQAPCQDSAFSFAPDGEHVVFVQSCTYRAPGCDFLTILDLTTGETTELTETLVTGLHFGPISLPAWSPDGTQIAYTRETALGRSRGERDELLYVIDVDGKNIRQIAASVPRVLAPQWSADGSAIAFMSDLSPDGSWEQDIYTVRPDGSDLIRLTADGRSAWPEWTLSNQIRFRNQNATQTSSTFSLMDADGSNAVVIVELEDLADAIDPPRELVSNLSDVGAPGDPGRTFFWQPAD